MQQHADIVVVVVVVVENQTSSQFGRSGYVSVCLSI
jgi:hypothetical protein